MNRGPVIAVNAEDTLRRHGLDNFDALWNVQAELVDEPNRARGGVSSVSRLMLLDGNGVPRLFYLKRQSNYSIRSVRRPWGESTVAREFDNIGRCARLGIPALEAAYFAQRRQGGELQAILLTRALDGYLPLDEWFERWVELGYRQQQGMIRATAAVVARLHACDSVHNCLYPKHVFLKSGEDGVGVRLIDLEKTRARRFLPWGPERDLDALNRHSRPPSRSQRLRFLLAYLGKNRVDAEVRNWVNRVVRRSAKKPRERH